MLPDDKAELGLWLAMASGARRVDITGLGLLAGGAIQENWALDVEFGGGSFNRRERLVLRTDAATGIASSLSRVEEFAVLRAVFAAGVTVPEPLWVGIDPAVIGKPFFVMRHVPGTAQGRQITTDPAYARALPSVAARLGEELARIQSIRPPRSDLPFLPLIDAAGHIAAFRAYLDGHPQARPVLEWATHWLEIHIPEALPPVLCHRDFRTGNYVLDVSSGGASLTGILDWEFAGWGDPDEDIGWLCCKGWRFARLDRELGGISDRAPFFAAYEATSGRRVDPERVRFWEILANVRWAIMALQQSDRHLRGGDADLSTAIIGRRATECDLELLMLLDAGGPPASSRRAGKILAVQQSIRDAPGGAALAGLGREWLLREALPLLPSQLHRELRLVATAIAIAEREATAGDAPGVEALEVLRSFYRDGEIDGATASTAALPRLRGRQRFAAEDGGLAGFMQRLAADLRAGAFEQCASRERAARAILWRVTILKLREGNPGFLVANGFGD